jgi:hypothetical protein
VHFRLTTEGNIQTKYSEIRFLRGTRRFHQREGLGWVEDKGSLEQPKGNVMIFEIGTVTDYVEFTNVRYHII